MGHALTLDCGNTESGFRVPWARISTQPGKWQVGKCHVEASPELRFGKFRILDLRIVPPPPAGPRGTKRSPKLLSSSRISRRQSINAHARGLSKESSGIRQNDKSGRNPGPYENCFQSGFLLLPSLPSFPLVHPGNSDFRTLPSRQASREFSRNPGPTKTVFSQAFSSFSFPLVCTPGSDFRTLPSLSAGIASSHVKRGKDTHGTTGPESGTRGMRGSKPAGFTGVGERAARSLDRVSRRRGPRRAAGASLEQRDLLDDVCSVREHSRGHDAGEVVGEVVRRVEAAVGGAVAPALPA